MEMCYFERFIGKLPKKNNNNNKQTKKKQKNGKKKLNSSGDLQAMTLRPDKQFFGCSTTLTNRWLKEAIQFHNHAYGLKQGLALLTGYRVLKHGGFFSSVQFLSFSLTKTKCYCISCCFQNTLARQRSKVVSFTRKRETRLQTKSLSDIAKQVWNESGVIRLAPTSAK